jgi:predicted MFS family arabinose efflux permease
MTPHRPKNTGFKIVLRKEYKLYYLLCLLYGARKQIFLTFGPWVLIKIFNQTPKEFAILGLITAFIGIFFKPLFGSLIDKWGERKVMMIESTLLLFVFGGYAFSQAFFNKLSIGWIALYVIAGCYVFDQLLSAITMARAIYIKKIAVHPDDISPTLSMGISIDHIVSMSLPWVGGYVWITFGYQYVFIGGMAVVLGSILVASKIRLTKDILNNNEI